MQTVAWTALALEDYPGKAWMNSDPRESLFRPLYQLEDKSKEVQGGAANAWSTTCMVSAYLLN